MSKNNTVCESNCNKNNNFKKTSLTVNTNYIYFKHNYENAYNEHRTNFNWDKIRMFIPKNKNKFDYKLLIYDYDTDDYVCYNNNFEIDKIKVNKIIQKNRNDILVPLMYYKDSDLSKKSETQISCCCCIQ